MSKSLYLGVDMGGTHISELLLLIPKVFIDEETVMEGMLLDI